MSIKRRAFLASLAALPLAPRIALARRPEVFQTGGVAINGADPVAYFDLSEPDARNNPHRLLWRGAEWHFDSLETMTLFESDPAQFAPQFGGYCAYAASLGHIAPTIPEAWTILQGRLYLNANLRVRELWLRNAASNIAKAEAHWPGLLG